MEDQVSNQRTVLLSGRALIMESRKYAVEDRAKSWLYTLSTLLLLVGTMLLTYYNYHWGLKLLCSVISGLFIVKFFVIYHDYQHRAILQNSFPAKVIMTIFGIFVLAPTNIWRRTHDHHHQHNSKLSNSGIGSYPLLSRSKFEKLSSKQRFVYLAARHPLTIFAGYITLFIFDFNVKSILKSPKKHWDSLVALVIHVGVGFCIAYFAGVKALFLSWIIPFVIADAMGAYLFYAQHNFPGATFEDNENWSYADAAINSTSFLAMNPVMNWFTGNIGYHHVHHVNHLIPFYKLKSTMAQMPELQNPKVTTLKPKDVIACFKLKVWDPEKREMTGLK